MAWVMVPGLVVLTAAQALNLAPVVSVLGALFGLVGGVRPYVAQANHLLAQAEAVADEVDAARAASVAALEAEQKSAHDAALRAQADAQSRVDDAEVRVKDLEGNLAEFEPGTQVLRFLKDRSTSTTYTTQLGLVSLIRRDFERLSDLLQQREARIDRWRSEELERLRSSATLGSRQRRRARVITPPDEVPIDRIVLYIDDLDRCKPSRVVEVLEAVHLLLAFRLFVVVVAVDPRWLRRCLEDQYPELLSAVGVDGASQRQDGLDRTSTPQDYLEKIFQIPFYLRPIRDDGFIALVKELVGADVAPESVLDPSAASSDSDGSTQVDRQPGDPTSGPAQPAATNGRTTTADSSSDPGVLEIDRLTFTTWEVEDMENVSPLFRTPRSAKRFLNTYRLVRSTIEPADRRIFEGTRGAPGTYRSVQLLLAVVAGYPNVAPRFLMKLAATSGQPRLTWPGFVAQCRSPNDGSPAVDPDDAEWTDLCDALTELSTTEVAPKRVATLLPWVPRVARYSFSVTLPGALDNVLESGTKPTGARSSRARSTPATTN
jgi:hypothetical protein